MTSLGQDFSDTVVGHVVKFSVAKHCNNMLPVSVLDPVEINRIHYFQNEPRKGFLMGQRESNTQSLCHD